MVSINKEYFKEDFSEESQEELSVDLKSTIAHEMLHVYLINKNIDFYEVLNDHNKFDIIYSTMIDKFTSDVLDNFIHHLFIPKLINILNLYGCNNNIFFNEIKKYIIDFEELEKYATNFEEPEKRKERAILANSVNLSLDFWFNDKIHNKSRDYYILEREKYINLDIFNKCCDFLEKFPFDDIEFGFDNQKFFKPLFVLFDDIYKYIDTNCNVPSSNVDTVNLKS